MSLISGSEPIVSSDFEQLARQRAKVMQTAVERTPADQRLPGTISPMPALQTAPAAHAPVAHVPPADFRGRLKPPTAAAVAKLAQRDSRTYLHTVTFRGESLALLADWYTESAGNATRIAAVNRRAVSHRLRIGEKIVIPSSLMLNPEPLPEALVP